MPQLYPSSPEKKNSIDSLVEEQQKSLYSISTVFPFRLFPTTVSADKKKIDIIEELFFRSKQIQSILIQDIITVSVETSLFFGKLTIHDKLPMHDPIEINYLPRADALKMRRVIEGLLVGDRSQVDTTQTSHDNLVSKLEVIGSAKSTP